MSTAATRRHGPKTPPETIRTAGRDTPNNNNTNTTMNKKFILSALTMLSATALWAQDYTLQGTIDGLPDGTTLELVPMSHDNEKPIGTTTVADGRFVFKGDITTAEPRCLRLGVKETYGSVMLMVGKGDNIALKATATQTPSSDGTPLYRFADVTVTGSSLTDTLRVYEQKRADLDKLYAETHDPYKPLMEKLGAARQAKNKPLVDSIITGSEYAKMAKDENRFFKTVEQVYMGAINSHKDSYWGPLLTLYYFSYLTPEQKTLYESFSPEAQNSWYGRRVKDEIFPGGGAGETAKELSVKSDDGKVTTLDQLCQGKTYVLIDFWASWCAPCRREIPNIKAQYALYKDKGFMPLSISIDKDEKAWRKALAEEKLEWPNFLDRLGAADAYGVRSIPAMYLVDAKTKKIVASGNDARGTALAKKLAELYK